MRREDNKMNGGDCTVVKDRCGEVSDSGVVRVLEVLDVMGMDDVERDD